MADRENPETNAWSFERVLDKYKSQIGITPDLFLSKKIGETFMQDLPGVRGHRIGVHGIDISKLVKCTQGQAVIVDRGDYNVLVPKQYPGSKHSPKSEELIIVYGGTFTIVRVSASGNFAFLDPKS